MPLIRTSLSFHSPESIYSFLQKHVGPLYMIVKNGQAIISFTNQEHSIIALNKFSQTSISGFQIKLQVYQQGDLQAKESKQVQAPAPVGPSEMIIEVPPKESKISKEARMIDQALQIRKEDNPIQCLIKNHRKQIIQQVLNYNVLYDAASDKFKQQLLKCESEVSKKEVTKQMERSIQIKLKAVSTNLKKQLCAVSSFIKNYHSAPSPIQIDPSIESRPVQGMNISANQFALKIEYINPELNAQIKKIAALNQNQFVCTGNYTKQSKQAIGWLKVYKKYDQHQRLSIQVKQGTYGLLVLDKYVLVGNFQGRINFYQLANQTDHEISEELHGGYIFQILYNTKYSSGNSILTLGGDFVVKAWNVTEEIVTQDVSTLFFQERLSFNCQNQEIMSIDLLEQGRSVLVGSRNNMKCYDLVVKRYASETGTKSNIFKLKRMTPNIVAVANTNYISFADPRTKKCDNGFRFKTEIRAIQPLNEQTVFYGAIDGEVGTLDSRMTSMPLWSNRINHKQRIYDICKLGDMVLTGDKHGLIAGWMGKPSTNNAL